MTVAAAVALISVSVLAADAVLDLNVSGFTKRLEGAQAAILEAVGHHQRTFAVRAWARDKAVPEQQCPRSSGQLRDAGIGPFEKQKSAYRSAIAQEFGPSQMKMVG